ncbi:hypothetical protein LWI28_001110 [Acer negundo]|uniref:Diacylglycerol O-acyltransferase n=1 Tax=Acer negundo TaxID=4023 RepID=A0AAD5I830_ACENE|nr:hypothetical protein LWI28_001110 [Acer negundo]KAK4835286.1 hypothetical protein QYF36_007902 [Acer negundo]
MVNEAVEALSPAARLFHAPRFNCHIIAILGCKTSINPSVIKQGLNLTLLNHPRFSSKLVMDDKKGVKMKWIRTTVNVEDHVIVPDYDPEMANPDQFVEDYISYMTTMPMDFSKPLWELHLLNVKSSEAEATGVFRIHHSLGDGASLISLLLACTRKTSDPKALPSVPEHKGKDSGGGRQGFWWLCLAIWRAIRLIWNTIMDLLVFVATLLFLKDTKNPLKGESDGVDHEHAPRRIVHRNVSLDDIKLVKKAMKMTVNDVVLGITQAGLSRSLNRSYGNQNSSSLPKSMRFRATVLVGLRPTKGIQELTDMMEKESKGRWGNCIGYVLIPFKIGLENDPLDYVRKAKATIDRKKLSLEALCTYSIAQFVIKIFGFKVGGAIAKRVLSRITMAFSNVVGPLEDISFYGHPIAFLAPTVYGHPQALTIHYQSYVNKMTIVLAVDPNVISDPHQLCADIQESLTIIKDAVQKVKNT